ncbi:sensor histidine kinase [Compostimonas suwonensis]|nr:sensor histidine kinase [Compostimonas suwonensis]
MPQSGVPQRGPTAPREQAVPRGWGGPPSWAGEEPRFRMPRLAVLLIPVILSFVVQVPAAVFFSVSSLRAGNGRAGDGDIATAALAIGLALLGPLALLASRRFPGPVVALVTAAATTDLLVAPDHGPPYISLAFAIVLGMARGARVWAFASVAAGWLLCVTIGAAIGLDWNPFRIVATTIGIVICLGIGGVIRSRRERMSAFRAESSRRRLSAEQAERVRIARELHDVLAHSLSQINVQASVGLHLAEQQPERAREALANIKVTSKDALDDVRQVLGMLRAEPESGERDESAHFAHAADSVALAHSARQAGAPDAPLTPQADLAQLPALVARVAHPGLSVRLDDGLTVQPPGAVQFAVYRIVQESLTNVVRHAAASEVRVSLAEEGDTIVVTVADDGRGANDPVPGGGLLGMRERAELIGGSLDAGPGPRGGFRVVARLPRGVER